MLASKQDKFLKHFVGVIEDEIVAPHAKKNFYYVKSTRFFM